MNILFFSNDYPYKDKNNYVFLQQLVNEIANKGHNCCVVSPYPVLRKRGICKRVEYIECSSGAIYVLRPNYLNISFIKHKSKSLSQIFHKRAINSIIRKLPFTPDVVYCHFWNQLLVVEDLIRDKHLPLFVATGESSITSMTNIELVRNISDYVTGVICVSSKNMKESIALGLTQQVKCKIIPNAINHNLFRRLNKFNCREQLCLPHDAFIVVFVGWFIERKGVQILSNALDRIDTNDVYSLFIGSGAIQPSCKNILFSGSVSHNLLPIYLNSADIFVLPTLNEGCCNAIVEALACGLPVVSSDRDFNYDILNENNSILVNPLDELNVLEAIVTLKNDTFKRNALIKGALETAKNLSLSNRADRILEFINHLAY